MVKLRAPTTGDLLKKVVYNNRKKNQPEPEPRPSTTPPPVPTADVDPNIGQNQVQVFDIQGTSKQGVTLPDGRTFYGLNKEEVAAIGQQELARQTLPEGVVQREEVLLAEQQAAQRQAVAEQLGQITPEEQQKSPISQEQAVKVGTAGVIPGVIAGAGAGAAAGLAGGPAAPITIPLGIVAGAAAGFFTGYKANIGAQKKGIIRGQKTNVADAEKNLMFLISIQNQGKGDPVLNQELFNEGLSVIAESYEQLKLDTMDQQALFTGQDGTPQLMKFETFYRTGRDVALIVAMQEAIINPDPSKVVDFNPSFEFEDD